MYSLGFDIGGTKCAVVLGKGELGGEIKDFILDKIKFDTEPSRGWEKIVEELFLCSEALLEKNGIKKTELIGIGISCGGPLDSKTGVIKAPPNLPDWDNVPITKLTAERFGVKAVLQNDANACAVAEWRFGAGKGFDNVVFLTFGTGMGAGLILDGRLYTGTNDMAGEVGHIRLSEDGPVGYGKAGSFEGYCSGGGIANSAALTAERYLRSNKKSILFENERDIASLNAKNIAAAREQGDEFACEVYRVCAEKLGLGLSVLIDILNPQAIVIGSIYERNSDYFYPIISEIIKKEALEVSSGVCRILPAVLGDSIGDYAALGILF